jgi:dUTP pyrophosphatase
MYAYLAHPIDQAGESSWLGSMLGDLNQLLVKAEIGAFRPGMAYLANTGNPDHVRYISEMNNIAIHQADCLIAVLPANVPTLGTPVEVGFALSMHKPVLIFTDITHSIQLAAWAVKGATVIDMSAEGFTWPEPQYLIDWLAVSQARQESLYPASPALSLDPVAFGEAFGNAAASADQTMVLPDGGMLIKPPPILVAGEAANLHTSSYPGDAGIDLRISEQVRLFAGQYSLVGTGVHVAIPDGYFGWITGRSSTWAKYRCDVRSAVIDSGYRGELMVGIENRGQEAITFEPGYRLAQLVLLPAWNGGVVEVEDLPPAERGHNGYGSSGH